MLNIRTDLAIETHELYQENKKQEIPGVEVVQEEKDLYTITHVKVVSDEGSKIMGKEKGEYITIECSDLKKADADLKDEMSQVLAKEFKKILPHKKLKTTLVVGLGNWNITPDALGPQVVSKVLVTRHLFETYKKEFDPTMACVSAISPGVMGITGIETFETIYGIVKSIKPDLVIAIDALASRKMQRVYTTVQIATSGIHPGSGIGNKRKGLNEEALGVPVIALGVPTVVDAATLTHDTIDLIISNLKEHSKQGSEIYGLIEALEDEEKYQLIKNVLEPYGANVIVTTKDIDQFINDTSQIIANGINIALHPGIDLKDVNRYLQ
jgi:spore protease